MIVLYSEIDIVDQVLFFKDDLPHWNSVIQSGIHLCLNLTDKELDTKFTDPEDPVFLAYSQSATMLLPVALKNDIEKIKDDLSLTAEYPQSIFLLEISKEAALNTRKNYGSATYSVNEYPENILSFSHYVELEKDNTIHLGWGGIIDFEKPISNSLVITDNYLFTNQDKGANRGFSNLVNFVDAFIPDELSIDYHITIFAEDCDRTNDWWVKEFGKLVALIKPLRGYDIKLELVLTKSIHKRTLISNYVVGKTDQGYDVFHATEVERIKLDNDFDHNEIFSNIDNTGTKYYQSAINTLEKLEKIGDSVCAYVQANNNAAGRRLFGCNPDKTIKNRLLN